MLFVVVVKADFELYVDGRQDFYLFSSVIKSIEEEIIKMCQVQFHFLYNSLIFRILTELWYDWLMLLTLTMIVTVT